MSHQQVDTPEPDGSPVTELTSGRSSSRTTEICRPTTGSSGTTAKVRRDILCRQLGLVVPRDGVPRKRSWYAPETRAYVGSPLGTIDATNRRIKVTPDTRPVRQQAYRAREVGRAEVTRMLKHKVFRPSQSEWASPVVLAPNSDGSMRFCVDYRRLNAVTKRDS